MGRDRPLPDAASLAEARHRAEELARMLSAEMQERKRAEAQMGQTARLISLGPDGDGPRATS